jgi:hypothetical protein
MSTAPAFLRLSNELIFNILSSLNDITALPSVLLASRRFYGAMNDGLPSCVLHNQIPASLLPYAIAVHEASQTEQQPKLEARTAAALLHLTPKAAASHIQTITLTNAIKIGRLHRSVATLAEEIATTYLSRLPNARPDRHLSPKEHHRICRALYRAQFYFTLLRDPSDLPPCPEEIRELQFDPCAPWINEQLACIADFLEDKLRRAGFEEVAAHDVFFGELEVDYLSKREENGWMQHYVSQIHSNPAGPAGLPCN